MSLVVQLAFGLCVLFFGPVSAAASEKVLYEKNSLYQYIVVTEDPVKGLRYVRNNERHLRQGGINLRKPDELVFEYYRMTMMSLAFLDREPRDILVVGLGAGAIPKYLHRHYPEAAIDIVEIDPEMLAVAQKYFAFKEDGGMRVHINDGRMFIKRAKKKYDLIVLDAYRNGSIPFHLTTREFLAETKKILKPGGAVAANILSEQSNEFHDATIVTYRNVFRQLYLFTGEASANYVFIATDEGKTMRQSEVAERAKRLMARKRFDSNLPKIAEGYTDAASLIDLKAEVLTDDFAPVDILQHRRSRER